MKNVVVHIGCMRCASTYLQTLFKEDPRISLILKSRFFSYDPYYKEGPSHLSKILSTGSDKKLIIDSDENYSLGRFKSKLIQAKDIDFNFRKELSVIEHDVPMMAKRIKATYPNARILMVIRNQADWIKSVYKHDIQHFGIDSGFESFLKGDLGQAYNNAANFNNLYDIYVGLFGKDNVKVLLLEDLKKNKALFYKNLSEIVGFDFAKADLNRRSKNDSKSDGFIYLQRILNRISQHDPEKKENIIYRHSKYIIYKAEKIIDKSLKKELISEIQLQNFKDQFVDGNKALSKKIKLHDEMKELGYFS